MILLLNSAPGRLRKKKGPKKIVDSRASLPLNARIITASDPSRYYPGNYRKRSSFRKKDSFFFFFFFLEAEKGDRSAGPARKKWQSGS